MKWALLLLLALPANANAVRFGGQTAERSVTLPSGPPSLVIAALPYARTVTCTGAITLTGTAPGAGAVSWAASPDGASGSCTGTTSWSCAVSVSPNAAGEGVETITITQAGVGGSSRSVDVGFYVSGAHSCFLAQSINGTYNSGLVDADAVATWVNLGSSALNVTQATGSAQPSLRLSVVGGQPVVRCDGGDGLAAATAANWAFLSDGTDWSGDASLLVSGASSTTGSIFSTRTTNATGTTVDAIAATGIVRLLSYNGSTNHLVVTGSVGSLNNYRMHTTIVDDDGAAGPDGFLFIDATANGSSLAGTWAAGAPSAPLNICTGMVGSNTRLLIGDLFRVLIYQSALSATSQTINKQTDEWALGGTLPVTP